jgi:chromate transport protein ChrA
MFMTAVTVTYIFFAPEGLGYFIKPLMGVHAAYALAVGLGIVAMLLLAILFARYQRTLKRTQPLSK